MRLCKPIVSTESCGVREQITHGVTGIIVDIDVIKIFFKFKCMTLNNEHEVDKLINFIEA